MSESPAEIARLILLAGIRAVNPRHLAATALAEWTAGIEVRTVDVIAVGKAANDMMLGARDALGRGIRSGIVISPEPAPQPMEGVIAFTGGHPMPTEEGELGATAVAKLLLAPNRGRRTLVLISGGASALMTLPAKGISLGDVIETSRALMNAGADIRELNCVRKHLDQLKGGRMAKLAGGVPLRALVLSDVIGDPLDVIGSGPLVADPTTYADAIEILKQRGVWAAIPESVRTYLRDGVNGEHQDTPKPGDPCFARIDLAVIGNNALAVQGAAAEARRRGFFVEVMAAPIFGEAREAGAAFVQRALELAELKGRSRNLCLVGGGETTVTVTGPGIGGRNLEFAAAAALGIDGMRGITVGAIGTDGRDGPTDAAGAIVDGGTAARVRQSHMDLAGSLHDNDTLRVLDAAGAVLRTGATGTNVMDLHVATIQPVAGAALA